MNITRIVCSTFLALAATPEAIGQLPDLPPTIDCVEVVHAQANDTLTDYVAKRDDLKLTFSEQTNGKFAMIGNLGLSELITVRGEGFVQLIEQSPVGNMNLTTIVLPPRDGVYRAVHSRHSVILGDLVPSQTLLACRAR